MIVWGGKPGSDTENAWRGGRYHPAKGWSPLSRANEPIERTYAHTAVWGGDKMIVFGGFGVRRVSDVGVPGVPLRSEAGTAGSEMSSEGAPGGRGQHTAVWTGKEMIVSGVGSTSPGACRRWCGTDTVAVSTRYADLLVADGRHGRGGAALPAHRRLGERAGTGSRPSLILWGGLAERVGDASASLSTGATYDPDTDRWTLYPAAGAPAARCQQVAVWTGSGCLLLWGGADVHAIDTHLSGRRRTAGAVRAGRLHHQVLERGPS